MLSVRAGWRSMNSITSPTAAPCRLEEALPTRLFCFASCKPKDSWVLPSFPPNYSHLGSLKTRVFLTEPGTHNQMTRATRCFMLRWSLCSVFCCCNTQMSSAKVFKKPDLLRPNFNHQWAVCVIILSHQSMPVSSPSKLLQISVVKNINNLISPHCCSFSSNSFRDWASLWNSKEKFIHLFESKHLCTISLAQWLPHSHCNCCIFHIIWQFENKPDKPVQSSLWLPIHPQILLVLPCTFQQENK